MRGSGYAISEILIFLAIAGIMGFLAGWVVFYRRPARDGSELSEANPNHVRQLESRTRAAESKLGRIEKRASALLATLEKRSPVAGAAVAAQGGKPAPDGPADADGTIAPAAAAPEGAGKQGPREVEKPSPGEPIEASPITVTTEPTDEDAETTTEPSPAEETPGDETKPDEKAQEPAATEDEPDTAEQPEPSEQAADEAEAEVEAAAEPTTGDDQAPDEGEPVEDGLTDADDRLAKLEATLDKLSEKLAELDEE